MAPTMTPKRTVQPKPSIASEGVLARFQTENSTLCPRPSLSTLPIDILINVIRHLGYFDNKRLKKVSRLFYFLADTIPDSNLFKTELSHFAIKAPLPLLACVVCKRLLPRQKFDDANRRIPRGRRGWEQEAPRFCAKCGMSPISGTVGYDPGCTFRWGGETFVYCVSCSRWENAREGVIYARPAETRRIQEENNILYARLMPDVESKNRTRAG